MAFELKRRVYEALPKTIKRQVGRIPFPWIAGRSYRAVYKRRLIIDQASKYELRAYQERELGKVLRFAVDQIPAYKQLSSFVSRFKPFDSIKEFPFLDKETLIENLEYYLPRKFRKIPHYETSTGGTSGRQLKIFLDDESQSIEMGFMHRQWNRTGYTWRSRKATFRGVPFGNLKPGIFWQENPVYNELQFSPFHMTETNLGCYVDKIIEYAPSYFHGYPSSLDSLAEYVLRHNLSSSLPPLSAVFMGSEGATRHQRERIERAFKTRSYSWYGHSERVVLAGECENNSSYHSFPDYGFSELIELNGTVCSEEGSRGEIIGTGFLNRCMPLIRYRTGDFATRLDSRCDCGRHWDRFCDVEGRWQQDMVVGRSGAKMSVAALNMHGPLFDKISRYQYYQDIAGVCVIKVVAAPAFTEVDRLAIQCAYQQKVGDELIFKVVVVEEIPLTPRGKLKVLDSRIEHITSVRNIEAKQ